MKVCKEKRETVCPEHPKMCRLCGAYREQTNADRIRAMTDEELERFLGQHSLCSRVERCPDHGECHKCVLDWLQQPVKEGADHA